MELALPVPAILATPLLLGVHVLLQQPQPAGPLARPHQSLCPPGRRHCASGARGLGRVSNILALECAARPSVPLGLSVNFQAKEQ